MNSDIEKVKKVIQLPENQIRKLLDENKYDVDQCLEKYFLSENNYNDDKDQSKVLRKRKSKEPARTMNLRSKSRRNNEAEQFAECEVCLINHDKDVIKKNTVLYIFHCNLFFHFSGDGRHCRS
jgi:hypothetical protein